jgi:molecular chaperone DnaK
VAREFRLDEFRRGNAKWRGAFGKLKGQAEEAKIRLSNPAIETTDITIDFLPQDAMRELCHFEYELKKSDVERLAEPFIARSINICRQVLSDKRLGPENIEKIILVGGPTLMPYLRDRLSDRAKGLGIPLEFRVDPLTVVARGASIFAGTQKIKFGQVQPAAEGQFSLELDYKAMGPEVEPDIAGKVTGAQVRDFSGYTIEFINSGTKPPWRSGKLGLGPEGTFMTTLWAEKGHANTFEIELCDPRGRRVPTVPAQIDYTVGMVITDQPLIHSVGVATASNEIRPFFEKGTPLPCRRRELFKTAFEVRQGKEGDLVRIPVMEGENARADRNNKIGELVITAKQIKRDLPIGSDVEVTIVIDESRIVHVQAYIPILDEIFDVDIDMGFYEKIEIKALEKEFQKEKERLAELRKKTEASGDSAAGRILGRIDEERMIPEVERSLAAASADHDAKSKAKHRLQDLKIALDKVEDAAEWPSLVSEAEGLIPTVRNLIQEHGNSADMRTFESHEAEVRKAMKGDNPDILRKRIEEMRTFVQLVLDRKGIMQAIWFEKLCEMKGDMKDRATAEQLISQGQRAIANGNVEDLRSVNKQLAALLPTPPPPPDISTVH